ncbi:molybdopterin-dependent oxidoreductase [Mycolicibacterium fluoranthenivorans]|uniref:Molybdopterin-dependent oxidoreductase n=1 Tax=Mycolicibacterium fluoranthenivorans TaxID=258505 RepID=A0A7G8P6W4_9MYCO|nr:molybdopterin-dependent oxidoreductase [Mycolicibacterium fluoranthenivorans]QNJ90080.1 molybdopterin-dependent oxidoreductase [Mycolicibacterium fluoranthenivorans]
MTSEQRITYCRICEALCGVVATVENGRLMELRPDGDNPLSRGRVCPKGIAMADIQNDPDRVLTPLRRRSDGGFDEVSWDDALADIAQRLRVIVDRHGGGEVGHYLGNPAAFGYATSLWHGLFMKRLNSAHQYTAGSQDINSRFVASRLLYGAISQLPFPDLPRTDFLLVVGANPLVSHGSALRSPRIKEDLASVVERGGRVVIIDPRRTETARKYEHVAVYPDSDAWLLLSLLHVIFEEGLADHDALARQATGSAALRAAAAEFAPERTERLTGVEAHVVRELAHAFATAPSACAYGRTGACLGRHATLVCFLLDALSIVTGNLDRPGGTLFARGVVPLEEFGERAHALSYAEARSRVGSHPDVMGTFPAAIMAEEITTPGAGQLRALISTAGNPVLSVPNGQALAAALPSLDLVVAMDLYMNETNRHADYILPATTFLERSDMQWGFAAASPTVFMQSTEAVVPPYGQAREEWRVYDDIARLMGMSVLAQGPLARWNRVFVMLERLGLIRLSPRSVFELLLRLGPYGDRFGLRRGGLTPRRLRAHPHGVVLAEHAPTGILHEVVQHADRRVHLSPAAILNEVNTLGERHPADPAYPLRLIGLRELRSHNSWMHNSETLMKGARSRRHRARISPADATAAGLVDGGRVRIVSATGVIETEVLITDEVNAGTVAVPHGWGHDGGWQRANAAGGANVNDLTSNRNDQLERLAGMSVLNGVAVRVESIDR